MAVEDRLDLRAQLRGFGEPQRREQPEAHRLAVAVALVAAGRLDRVADCVAEVEHRAAPGVALVGGDDLELRPRAREDELVEIAGIEVVDGADALPEAPPAIRPVLSTSTNPAASSARGSVASASGSASTAAGRW